MIPLAPRTPAARLRTGAVVAALGVALLAGCTPTDATPADDAAVSSAPAPATGSPAPTADAAGAMSEADLEALFTGIQFRPGEYETTAEMLESIYPGLTVSDASCLAPFGAGWEATGDATVEFGTSNDRSMTAVVASSADEAAAEALVAQAEDAIARCADGQELFAMQGMPVTTTVSPFDLAVSGADESRGWQVAGDVAGSPFTLVGATVRVGQNTLAIVGWDPATNADYVAQATQLFVDRLAGAAG
ncbi:MAG: hypothetical protein PGN24_10735 [Microbacterium arborescens]